MRFVSIAIAVSIILGSVWAVWRYKNPPIEWTGEINFEEEGNIVPWNGNNDWALLYERAGEPALKARLIFSEESECYIREKFTPCDEILWATGDDVKIEGEIRGKEVRVVKLSK